jgi:hypothetical protein
VTYTTRQAAEVVGLPEATVRGCARAGLLSPQPRGQSVALSFRDLLVLRMVKALTTGGVPLRRLRRQLGVLRRTLPADVSLSQVTIGAHSGHVLVRSGDRSWRADTGQVVFDFAVSEPPGAESASAAAGTAASKPAGTIEALPVRRSAPPPTPVASLTSDEWFEHAVALEDENPVAAMDAYRRALQLCPDCTETLVNLGRLCAENGDPAGAADCFREALRLDPRDATAHYNLGVVAQDQGDNDLAITLYEKALELDAGLAEAHYNLATLFDRCGNGHAAIRHINAYRKLTR